MNYKAVERLHVYDLCCNECFIDIVDRDKTLEKVPARLTATIGESLLDDSPLDNMVQFVGLLQTMINEAHRALAVIDGDSGPRHQGETVTWQEIKQSVYDQSLAHHQEGIDSIPHPFDIIHNNVAARYLRSTTNRLRAFVADL